MSGRNVHRLFLWQRKGEIQKFNSRVSGGKGWMEGAEVYPEEE